MRSAQVGSDKKLRHELHPELGYFWPSPTLRRSARLGAIGAGVGAAVAAFALVALTLAPGTDGEINLVGTADAAVQTEQPVSSIAATITPTPCEQQTWPYIESKCMAGAAANRTVRVLPPDAPPQTDLRATAGASTAAAAKQKRAQATASSEKQKAPDRAARRNDVQDVPERAYAKQYPSRRSQPQRREWHSW